MTGAKRARAARGSVLLSEVLMSVKGAPRGASRAVLFAFGAAGLAAFAGLGSGLASCNVYDTSLLEPAPDASPPQRGGVGFWSGPADDPSSCFSARFPRVEDRPAPGNTSTLAPIFLAFQTLNTGSLNDEGQLDPDAWRNVGFDLDGTCTGSETCDTGNDTRVSCKSVAAAVPIDGAYCRDNSFGRLGYQAAIAPETSRAFGLNADGFNCALCVGAYNYLIRLSGYNGEADDDRVRVDLYPSPGLDTLLPWDCSTDDWKKHPCFASDQKWQIRDDVLSGPLGANGEVPASKQFDEAAYVRQGTLFMTLPKDTQFWFPGQRALATAFPLTIRQGFVAAKLARGRDGLWRLSDGVIAGRSTRDDVIKGLRLVGVCEDNPNYAFVEQFVSGNLDVLVSGEKNPQKPCDGLSLGLPFTAIQATPGAPAKVVDLVECQRKPTGDAGTDASVQDASAQDGSSDAGAD